jgi:hypothetical protein
MAWKKSALFAFTDSSCAKFEFMEMIFAPLAYGKAYAMEVGIIREKGLADGGFVLLLASERERQRWKSQHLPR